MSFEPISGHGDTTERLWGDQQDRVDLIRDLTDEIADCNSALRDSLHIPEEIDYEEAATIASQIYEKAKDWYLERTLEEHNYAVRSVAFSPDGKRIVSGGTDSKIRIWNSETGELVHTLREIIKFYRVNSVAFSPDGERIVSGGTDSKIRIWNVGTGQVERVFQGHDYRLNRTGVRSVAFSPDGKRIVSGGGDATTRIWNAKTGELVHTLRERETGEDVCSVAFSPDGKHIVSGGGDGMRIWNAETGNLVARSSRGFSTTMRSVAFSPDGKRVVSGDSDNTIRLWRSETGEFVRKLEGFLDVSSVAFSPDGRHIVSGSTIHNTQDRFKTLQVWNAETGKAVRGPQAYSNQVKSVAFSPDGKRIVSGDGDTGRINIWKFDVRLT